MHQEKDTSSQKQLACIGVSHKTAPIALREKLYIEPDILKNILPQIKKSEHLEEIAVLSTCNRLEFFLVSKKDHIFDQSFLSHHIAKKFPHLQNENPQSILDATYLFKNEEAVRHIFNVASSLDSLMVGETQITGQFKEAISLALDINTLGPIINRLSQEALSAAKKVRTQTDISKRPVSISHAAVDLARKVFSSIDETHVLIVGAGEMAQLAAKYALKYKPKRLSVCNRTLENAQLLVTEIGFGSAYDFSDMKTCLSEADIVISSTAAATPVISYEMVVHATRHRGERPLCFVDIALPRDIDPKASELDEVYLFDIDDLKQLVDEHRKERQASAKQAEYIIDNAVKGFSHWLNHQDLGKTIGEFRGYVQQIIAEESARTLSRDQFKQLPDDIHQQLKKMLEAIGGRFTADLGQNLKRLPQEEAQKILFTLANAFPMDQTASRKEPK